MSDIQFHSAAKPSCAPVDEITASYEAWLKSYTKIRESSTACGLYSFDHEKPFAPTVRVGSLCGSFGRRSGVLKSIWHASLGFTFYPQTDVLPISVEIASDEEAVLSDWVITGLDLYNSIRGCKILAPDARPEPAELASTSSR
jgi:hypothetical protein